MRHLRNTFWFLTGTSLPIIALGPSPIKALAVCLIFVALATYFGQE